MLKKYNARIIVDGINDIGIGTGYNKVQLVAKVKIQNRCIHIL